MTACPRCSNELETPFGCGACGALVDTETAGGAAAERLSPFDAFGLDAAYALDSTELRRRLLRFSRLLHPDFHGAGGPEQLELAERNTALLNEAFEALSDDRRRADLLLRLLGGPSETEERSMPQEFLMEVLEWNETLEAAEGAAPDAEGGQGSPELAALDDLERALHAERATRVAALRTHLDPLPEPGAPALLQVRRELNALAYLDRALGRIRDLRLVRASAR
jgi:molecular chaperone HscB